MSNIKKNHLNLINPSGWLKRFQHLIPKSGNVLDLASGNGRNSRYLLKQGYNVIAVDKNPTSATFLERHPNAKLIVADLEGASAWPLNDQKFDGIVVSNYLYRPLFSSIINALAQNGILIYDTFAEGNALYGSPRNPDYLLRPGELLDMATPNLQIIAYEHGLYKGRKGLSIKQRICAVKNLSISAHYLFPEPQ